MPGRLADHRADLVIDTDGRGMPLRRRLAARIPTWREIGASPRLLARVMNLWPPFRFAGIRVLQIEPGFTGARVMLRLHPLSRNYMGTQYGGSMYSMSDPFWVILLIHQLGDDYVVWDRQAQIEFLRPGTTDVYTRFVVDPAIVAELRAVTADGSKALRWFANDIVDDRGELVARVRREIYVRRRPT